MAEKTYLIAGGNALASGKYLQGNQISINLDNLCKRFSKASSNLRQIMITDIRGADGNYISDNRLNFIIDLIQSCSPPFNREDAAEEIAPCPS